MKKEKNIRISQKALNVAQQKIVKQNINIAISIGKKWAPLGKSKGLTEDDLIQEACVGLCCAVCEDSGKNNNRFMAKAKEWCCRMVQLAIKSEETANENINVFCSESRVEMVVAEDEKQRVALLSSREKHFSMLDKMLALLNKRERQVVCMLYGINRKQMDFRQTAQHLGIKTATVHRIYNVAMSKMEFSNINNYENN